MTFRLQTFVIATLFVSPVVVSPVGNALAQTVAEDCTVAGQNTFVADVMNDFYLWYQEIPTLTPASFDSPEAYLEAIRFRPIDNTFSSIRSQAATDAFFGEGQFVGFGYSVFFVGDDARISQVFPDGPAAEGGLARGDTLLFVNGRSMLDLVDAGELGLELGPSTVGYEVTLGWRTVQGTQRSATMEKAVVTIPPVSDQTTLQVDAKPVGYLHFRNFIEPSIEALDMAFADFEEQGISDIVLDLRYNGGGLVSVATHLASLIGGTQTSGQTLIRYRHNDKQTSRNREVAFENPVGAIDATRIVIITGRGTASASELIINGLKPFLDVSLVGRTSFGKPVGQFGFRFCEKVLLATSFDSVNAVGDGEYYDGFTPDCPMRDGLGRQLGDPKEARLKEALHLLEHGSCTADSEGEKLRSSLRTTRAVERSFAPPGLGQVINAW